MSSVISVAKLTDQVIRQTRPREKQFEVRCEHRRGLRLLVHPTGRKSLVMRYSLKGRDGMFKLAHYVEGGNSLARATEAWARAKEAIDAGLDPRGRTTPERDFANTVAGRVAVYTETKVAHMAPGTQINTRPVLGRLVSAYGSRTVESLRKSELVAFVQEASKRGPHAAHKAHQVLHAFLAWASSVIDDYVNPLSGTSGHLLPEVELRDRVLTDDELAELLRSTDHPFAWLLTLTGARRSEISDLSWSEVHRERLVIPAKRTKQGKTHEIHISHAIRSVLDNLPKTGKYVCNGLDRPLSGFSKLKKKMPKLRDHWTWHDLRRTFSTRCSELGVRQEVIDACTGHSAGTIQKTYNRNEFEAEKVVCWEKWAAHIEALVRD